MKKGEIWFSSTPSSEGREQSGTRPYVIIGVHATGVITVVPLTSNEFAKRFSNTILIKKSSQNKLQKDSVALIFQIKSFDQRRFVKKIGELEEEYTEIIKKEIAHYLR